MKTSVSVLVLEVELKLSNELPTTVGDNDVISFLDTEVVVRPCGNVVVAAHRKAIHIRTNIYHSTHAHNPKQHKATVVKTLFDRTDKIPNTLSKGKKLICFYKQCCK